MSSHLTVNTKLPTYPQNFVDENADHLKLHSL